MLDLRGLEVCPEGDSVKPERRGIVGVDRLVERLTRRSPDPWQPLSRRCLAREHLPQRPTSRRSHIRWYGWAAGRAVTGGWPPLVLGRQSLPPNMPVPLAVPRSPAINPLPPPVPGQFCGSMTRPTPPGFRSDRRLRRLPGRAMVCRGRFAGRCAPRFRDCRCSECGL